jgi:hypothetical protein
MKSAFNSYDPYLTYSSGKNYFVDSKGTPSFSGWRSTSDPFEMSEDAMDLWFLGRDAFAALPTFASIEEFKCAYRGHLSAIDLLREEINKVASCGMVEFTNQKDEPISPDFSDASNSRVIDIGWKLVESYPKDPGFSEAGEFFQGCFLFDCLEQIDSAIIGLCLDGGAVSAALGAANSYANFRAIESGSESLQRARSSIGFQNAMRRLEQDPKQKAKAFVKDCWKSWQNNPGLYKSQTAFATAMLTKVETDENGDAIISHGTITHKWIPLWTGEQKVTMPA